MRKLVPHRKAVLQISPISCSMCQNYESHHSNSIMNVSNPPIIRDIETELGLDAMNK